MKLKYHWLIFLAVAAATSLHAAEITGKVRDASGDAATVVLDGDALPAVGDSAEIYFKVPGADEEIAVASGKVVSVDAKVVKIKIEKTSGTLEKDQLARIKTGAAQATPAAKNSIVGEWVFISDKRKLTWVFKEDGTTSWAEGSQKVSGKYRVDYTKTPHQIDIEDIDLPGAGASGLYGIVEFETDGTMKMNVSEKVSTRPTAFNQYTTVFSRSQVSAGTTASTSPSPSGTAKSAAQPSIAGEWTSTAPGGGIVSFSFKEDGTLLFVVEDLQTAQSTGGKYRLDPSTQPQGIELFDFEAGDLKGQRLRGLFEFQSDGRLKLDFQKDPEAPALKEFSKEALVFSKATSPIVRPNKPAPTPYVAPGPSPDEKFFSEGQTLYERKDYDGAIAAYTKAISLNPKNAVAYNHRGICFVLKGDTDAAIADYEKAIELNPSLSEILNPLVINLRAKRSEERERNKTRTSPPEATPTATRAK
jgi:uncharacterized protein (TIGR03067 family)